MVVFERSFNIDNNLVEKHCAVEATRQGYKASEILVISDKSSTDSNMFSVLRSYQFECLTTCHFFKYRLVIVHGIQPVQFKRIEKALCELQQSVWLVNMPIPS